MNEPQLPDISPRSARLWPVTAAAVAFAVAALMSACGSSAAGDAASRTFRHVVTHTDAEYRAAPRLHVVIGPAVCGARAGCTFHDVSVAVGPSGEAALAEAGDAVLEYDSAGRLLGPVGGVGTGRGEYGAVAGLAFDSDGGLTLFDRGNLRLLRYDHRRALVAGATVRPPLQFVDAQLMGRTLVFFIVPSADSIGRMVVSRFEALDTTGLALHTVTTVLAPAFVKRGTNYQPLPPFFLARPSWSAGPERSITYTSGERSLLLRFDSAGARDLLIDAAIRPRAIEKADLDREVERVVAQFSPNWRARGRPFVLRAAAAAAKTYPVFTALRVLDDGTIWAREGVRPGSDSTRWDVFRPDGGWLGWTTLGAESRVAGGRLSRFVVVERDSAGTERPRWVRADSTR